MSRKTLCMDLAIYMATAAEAMGLKVSVNVSRESSSHYLHVSSGTLECDIRIADHHISYGECDYDFRVWEDRDDFVKIISEHFCRMLPKAIDPNNWSGEIKKRRYGPIQEPPTDEEIEAARVLRNQRVEELSKVIDTSEKAHAHFEAATMMFQGVGRKERKVISYMASARALERLQK